MENRTYGIAEKLTISGTSDSYKLNETTVILATPPTTTRDKYAVSLSDQSNTKEKDGNECSVLEVFRDGMSYAYTGGAVDYSAQKVNLADLIVYENWKKE